MRAAAQTGTRNIAGLTHHADRNHLQITAARFVRRISGSVNSLRDAKSSSEYSRIAIPSLTRPHRPERWFARHFAPSFVPGKGVVDDSLSDDERELAEQILPDDASPDY